MKLGAGALAGSAISPAMGQNLSSEEDQIQGSDASAGQQLSYSANIQRDDASDAELELTIATGLNPRTWPIQDGRIQPENIRLKPISLHPSEMFFRQLKDAEFDISEMSISSFLMTLANGDKRFVGLPIFTTHHFFHSWPLVRRDASINSPADLRGKRVGVPEYQQTAALWSRGALQHEWGVTSQEIEWWMERDLQTVSHASTIGWTPPDDLRLNQIPMEKNIGSMIVSGELDATLLYIVSDNIVDRSTIDLWNHPEVKPLFEDSWAEGIRYHEKTGLYPINHCVIIKREIAEEHPWAIHSLIDAFNRANDIADSERIAHLSHHVELGLISSEARDALSERVLHHGLAANRATIEAALQFSAEQGLSPRQLSVEEFLAAESLDT